MSFGFCYVGFVFLCMLMIPNMIWTKHKPQHYETYAIHENKILLMFERVGEVLVTCISLMFTDFNLHPLSSWTIYLILACILMVFYEIYWIRYFKSDQTMKDFYCSLFKIPLAGATLPVFAFFLLGIYGKSIWLILATIILGIGHIGIHLQHASEISKI